jgi:PKD repeat protein/PhoPQ-activated pathogenicity-related protein
MTLQVSSNVSTTPTNPLVVSSSADWVVPEECLSAAAGCMVSSGMFSARIPVSIRRDLLTLGTNKAKLYLSAGPSSQLEVDVIADDRIQSDFVADERSVGLGRPIVFRDLSVAAASAGPVNSWLWDFGDGTTSTDQNPTHLYLAPGTFDVSLTVKAGGEEETLKRAGYVKVNMPEVAVDFSASTTNIPFNGVVAFTDLSSSTATPITGWQWAFGDGVMSAERNPYHQYNKPGLYSVTLTVTTAFDEVAKTKANYINVRQKIGPTANFAISDVKPFVDTPIRFTDLSDPGTSPVTNWVWEFDDLVIVNDQNPVHTYAKVGTYNVKLTVFTQEGVSSKTIPIVVDYKPPTADFSVDNASPSVGQSALFTDRSQPGSNTIVSWAWDFGDKASSTEQNPLHAYAKAGTYTVSLTVRSQDPTNNEDTKVKQGFIIVIQPPVPDFVWTPKLALTGEKTDFNSAPTVAGTEPITRYEWDFDGNPATTGDIKVGPTATFTFTRPRVYNVSLNVSTATRAVKINKTFAVDKAPNPDFSASRTTGITSDSIVYTVPPQASDARPITGYRWSFGDGTTSVERRPTHKYAAQGSYTVKLTLLYRHSASLPADGDLSVSKEKAGYITITAPTPPAATIKSGTSCPITGMPVNFSVSSYSSPTRPISEWKWNFGDGSPVVVQTGAAPVDVTHTYTSIGDFQVTLTVTAAGLDPADGVRSFTLDSPLPVIVGTPLDEYVRTDDGAYEYKLVNTFPVNYEGTPVKIADAYIIQLTSQVWKADEIYSPAGGLWKHYLTLVNPVERLTDTAMIFVDGGSHPDFSQIPTTVDSYISLLATLSGSPIALLKTVPSEPIVFNDEVTPGTTEEERLILRSRSEDAIIAYSYNKYLESFQAGTPDTTWPLLFAMAKSAVKAMDTVQAIASNPDVGLNEPITDFVVAGASKRGWTTWMTGITDCRIKGIAPIVIDVLNMDKQMLHHRAAYGYWAPSIYDYAQERIFDKMLPGASADDQAAAASLLTLIDPYRYKDTAGYNGGKRLDMPKFLTNGTGDQFFLPDSAQWYFNDLPGSKYLNYIPNGDHGLIDSDQDIDPTAPDNPAAALLAWFMDVTQDKTPPEFSWVVQADGSIKVTVDPARKPKSVKMYYATAVDKRDFRLSRGPDGSLHNPDGSLRGPEWQPQTLLPTPSGSNTYVASQPVPAAGSYTGLFVQLTYANTARLPNVITSNPSLGITVPDLVFTTQVKVLPQNSDGTNLYPNFPGYVANAARPDVVAFPESKAPVVVLHGDATQMGTDYGELMAAEIVEFIPNYITSYILAYGVNPATLDAEWIAQEGKIDQRITDEMEGIRAGITRAGLTPPDLQALQWAHLVALRDSDSRNGAASAGKDTGTGAGTAAWRARTTGGETLHAVTVNGSGQLSWTVGGVTKSPQDYACIVVYIPEVGVPHTLLTFAGLSIGRTGVNLGGISWSDQINTSDNAITNANLGRLFLGRTVLYDSLNLNEAVELVQKTAVERSSDFILTDGRNHRRGCVIRTNRILPSPPAQPVYNRSSLFDTVAPTTAGMAFQASPILGSGYQTVIDGLFGNFTEATFLTLAASPSVTLPTLTSTINQLNAVYNCSDEQLRINFSYAIGQTMAWGVPYAAFDMQKLLP